ncbi:MAG: glycosyltransferase [Actinomycetota bacterium]
MAILRLAAIAAGSAYLLFRALTTSTGADPVLFVLLLTAEAFGVVRLAMELSLIGPPRSPERSPESGPPLDADVVVVVTDEPASEVRATVLSARLVEGRQTLAVVDVGDRVEIAELCHRLRIPRLAGAANADLGALTDRALEHCEAPFALIVPADVVVMPDVLRVSGRAFDDPAVGVVVSRTEQANATDTVDYAGYGEDRIRSELMIERLENDDALPWWPGMALVRRAALDSVGGVSRGARGVTLATGVRLQAAGWRMVDVPVIVARRLAPWNDDRHLHRWARVLHERLGVLVDDDAPRRNEYATRTSRRVYRLADLHVARSIQRLTLVAVLLATMYTSALPLVADPRQLVPLWLLWHATSLVARRVAFRRVGFVPWMVNDLRLLTTSLVVAWRALRRAPLGNDLAEAAPGRQARTALLVGLQVVFGLTVLVFATGLARPVHGDFVTFVTLAMSIWLSVVLVQARAGLRDRQIRQGYRTFEELEVFTAAGRLGVIGVSPFGLDVVSRRTLKLDATVRLGFRLPQSDGSTVPIEVSTVVMRSAEDGDLSVAYLRFHQLDDERMDRITEYVASIAGHRALRDDSTGGRPLLLSAQPIG